MIQFNHVSHWFDERKVLNDIDFKLTEKRIAIIGANGSGKSTFARLINGLIKPRQGSVLVDQLDVGKAVKEVRKKVGFVFQNPDNQIVFPIVEEDLAFGMKNIGMSRVEMEHQIEAVLNRYDLIEFRQHPTHLLSEGQKQILAISAVLVMSPQIVVFDEPTTLLDLRNKRRVAEVINQLDQQIVVITHDFDLIEQFDRVLVIEQGKVVCDDIPRQAIKTYKKLMS